ncbi:alpha/beta fold hydrolase [bacterium]|nr:alpha/beta fold hydrolase [bacterium]
MSSGKGGFQTFDFHYEGRSIRYRAIGEGPLIVMLHGWMHSGRRWAHIARHLSDRYTCLIPDLPGFGDSPSLPRREMCIRRYGDLLARLIIEWRPDRRPHAIIAHSMGGLATLEMTGRGWIRPERIMVLSVPSEGLSDNFQFWRTPWLLTVMFSLARMMTLHTAARFLQVYGFLMLGRWRAVKRSLLEDFLDSDPATNELLFRELYDYHVRPELLQRLRTVPISVVRGEYDRIVKPEHSQRLAKLLGGEYRCERGHGHTPMLRGEQSFLRYLDEFLGRDTSF